MKIARSTLHAIPAVCLIGVALSVLMLDTIEGLGKKTEVSILGYITCNGIMGMTMKPLTCVTRQASLPWQALKT